MTYLTIDQQIEAKKAIIRAGGKTDQPAGLMDELFGGTDEARLEDAINSLVGLVMMKTIQAETSGSPDSYDRL